MVTKSKTTRKKKVQPGTPIEVSSKTASQAFVRAVGGGVFLIGAFLLSSMDQTVPAYMPLATIWLLITIAIWFLPIAP